MKANQKEYGVREIQRLMKFSNVSLASYHLNRLENFDLVRKTPQNRYQVQKILPLGEYENFFVVKGRYLPKEAFFLSFYSIGTIFSAIFLILQYWWPMILLLFSIAIIASITTGIQFNNHRKEKNESDEID